MVKILGRMQEFAKEGHGVEQFLKIKEIIEPIVDVEVKKYIK